MINDNLDMYMEEGNNQPMTLKDWLIFDFHLAMRG